MTKGLIARSVSVVDRQITFLDAPFQFVPVTRKIADGLAQCILRRNLWLRFFIRLFN
jgi:hypothetical protein